MFSMDTTTLLKSNDHHLQTSTATPWVVCFIAALFFFFEFIQMNMFNAISANLMQSFSIDATQLGQLSAYYFYANLLFLPIAGMLLDRFSTRAIILIALLLCVVGIASFALSHSLMLSKLFRFMSGIGSAFCFLSSMRLASRWFPANRLALVTGLIVTMAMAGGMVAQTPLTLLTEWFGWREALLLDAGLGVVVAVLIVFFVQDYPPGMKQQYVSTRERLRDMGVWRSWRLSYLNKQNWLAGIYTCLMNLPLALLGAIWGNLYLEQVQHLSPLQASYMPTVLFLGAIVGGPLMGWFSDTVNNRRMPMLGGALISLLIVLTIIYASILPLWAYLILFFLLGVMTSTQVVSYPLVAESNSRMLTATSISVVSFCAISGYAIFQPLFGWLMDLHWQGIVIKQVHVYSASDYRYALLILPIGFIVGMLAVLAERETYGKSQID